MAIFSDQRWGLAVVNAWPAREVVMELFRLFILVDIISSVVFPWPPASVTPGFPAVMYVIYSTG